MRNVLIIGATGTLGRAATKALLAETDDHLTLFSRSADRLPVTDPDRVKTMSGNVMNDADLDEALQGQDAVFAALSGNMGAFAKKIVAAMDRNGVSQLVFICTIGIYNEIQGYNINPYLNPTLHTYRKAADAIEASDLNYTIIRPGWFISGPVDYTVTRKGEPFVGHDATISSIGDAVKRLVDDDKLYSRDSIGIATR